MTSRANITPSPRAFYFSTVGDDDFDGGSPERPKLTPQAAIDLAVALSPTPDAPAFVIGERGLYNTNLTLSNGLFFEAPGCKFDGDLTISGEVAVSIGILTGNITDPGGLNGLISGEHYGSYLPQSILGGFSLNDQNPVGLDTPLQIEFGAAQSNSDLQLSAAGAVTINTRGRYSFVYFVQYGRTGAGNVAWIFFRVLINGIQFGGSVFAKLDGANDAVPTQFTFSGVFDIGDVITIELVRDSQGNNSGGLKSEAPTLAWASAPSAALTIVKE